MFISLLYPHKLSMIPFRNRADKFWPIEVVRCDERCGFCPFVPESHQHASWLPPSWRLWRKKLEILNPKTVQREIREVNDWEDVNSCETARFHQWNWESCSTSTLVTIWQSRLTRNRRFDLSNLSNLSKSASGIITKSTMVDAKAACMATKPASRPMSFTMPTPLEQPQLWHSLETPLLCCHAVTIVTLSTFSCSVAGSQSWTRCFHPSISWHA